MRNASLARKSNNRSTRKKHSRKRAKTSTSTFPWKQLEFAFVEAMKKDKP